MSTRTVNLQSQIFSFSSLVYMTRSLVTDRDQCFWRTPQKTLLYVDDDDVLFDGERLIVVRFSSKISLLAKV